MNDDNNDLPQGPVFVPIEATDLAYMAALLTALKDVVEHLVPACPCGHAHDLVMRNGDGDEVNISRDLPRTVEWLHTRGTAAMQQALSAGTDASFLARLPEPEEDLVAYLDSFDAADGPTPTSPLPGHFHHRNDDTVN